LNGSKSGHPPGWWLSNGFGNFTGLDAAGADRNSACFAVHHSPDFLQIGIEPAECMIVGVADIFTEHRFFSTNFTHFGHFLPHRLSKFQTTILTA